MDLLIKGMEMPDCCYGCPLSYDMGEGNYACQFFNGYAPIDGRRDDCPLVEVKPHGRLIDADALKSKIIEQRNLDNPRREKIYNKVLDFIFDATTVLRASE